jgi:alkyl sulfatase BDS1-like metallo-beta-lactamase superfamily hydrolase
MRIWKRVALGLALAVIAIAVVLGRRVYVVAYEGSGMDPRIPAEYRVPPSINPELAEHSRLFEPRVYAVGARVHCAVGFGLANVIMIEGDDGVVVVDTGESLEQAEAVRAELRKITTKPVAAVVLTHHHADHVLGTSAFVAPEDAASGKIPIFAHESLVQHYADENSLIAELQTIRSVHMYGAALGPADRAGANDGIGPFIKGGTSGFLPPNRTVADRLEATVAGVRMQMVYVPSEAESEIAVYLPDDRILLSAEVVQDHTFPNVYTIRGARYRDPVKWVRSLDVLRDFDAEAMVLQHGPPVTGKAEVARVLEVYRDQIQFVHDQTIRGMNKGLTPQELAETVKLPPHLAGVRPWAGEFYGTVKHSVRGVYDGTVGWFTGDPVDLDPTPRVEYARRLVRLMGGRDKVLAEAKRAFGAGDVQFAAELATFLVRVDTGDMEARHLKAAAFRKQGYAHPSANWRNYYLVSAMELDAQIPASIYLRRASGTLGSAMKGLPAASQMAILPTRLRAEETLDQDVVVGVRYTDTGEEFRLHLRRGVLEVARKPARDAALVVDVSRDSMGAILAGAAFDEAGLEVTGDAATARQFFGCFERPFTQKPEVVVR